MNVLQEADIITCGLRGPLNSRKGDLVRDSTMCVTPFESVDR